MVKMYDCDRGRDVRGARGELRASARARRQMAESRSESESVSVIARERLRGLVESWASLVVYLRL